MERTRLEFWRERRGVYFKRPNDMFSVVKGEKYFSVCMHCVWLLIWIWKCKRQVRRNNNGEARSEIQFSPVVSSVFARVFWKASRRESVGAFWPKEDELFKSDFHFWQDVKQLCILGCCEDNNVRGRSVQEYPREFHWLNFQERWSDSDWAEAESEWIRVSLIRWPATIESCVERITRTGKHLTTQLWQKVTNKMSRIWCPEKKRSKHF